MKEHSLFIMQVLDSAADRNLDCSKYVRGEADKIAKSYRENKKTMNFAAAANRARENWLEEYLKNNFQNKECGI